MRRYTEVFMKLRPQERRLVVIVGLVFFAVINFLVIVPKFHDFTKASNRKQKAEDTLRLYQNELAKKPTYERAIRALESEGSTVPPEDQAIDFQRFYSARANENNVMVTGNSRLMTHTNQYFLEQEMTITVLATEKELVGFLHSLGSGASTMRVRSMSLRPDPSKQKLNANITLVASYQKKPPARATTPPPTKAPSGVPEPAKSAPVTNKTAVVSKTSGVTNKLGPQTHKRP